MKPKLRLQHAVDMRLPHAETTTAHRPWVKKTIGWLTGALLSAAIGITAWFLQDTEQQPDAPPQSTVAVRQPELMRPAQPMDLIPDFPTPASIAPTPDTPASAATPLPPPTPRPPVRAKTEKNTPQPRTDSERSAPPQTPKEEKRPADAQEDDLKRNAAPPPPPPPADNEQALLRELTIKDYLRQADKLYQRGEFTAAITVLNKIIAEYPDSSDAVNVHRIINEIKRNTEELTE